MANSFTATYATKSFCTYIVFFAMLIYTKFTTSVDLRDMRIEIEGWGVVTLLQDQETHN